MSSLDFFARGLVWFAFLVRAGLVHVQFESMHPLPQGNGAGCSSPFLLCAQGDHARTIPLLEALFQDSTRGLLRSAGPRGVNDDWEAWLHFFPTSVKETAFQAVEATRRIVALFDKNKKQIETLGRPRHRCRAFTRTCITWDLCMKSRGTNPPAICIRAVSKDS